MKVYNKLTDVRIKLQEMNIKKTGKAPQFWYFELKDFLPATNKLFQLHKLSSFMNIDSNIAKLTIVCTEDGSQMDFSVPFANATLNGGAAGNPVQCMGSAVTYLTRYLWVAALNIIEDDTVDSNTGYVAPTKQQPVDASPTGFNQVQQHQYVQNRQEPLPPQGNGFNQPSSPTCPVCNSAMTLRSGSNGNFYGCTKYASGCKGTRAA